MNRNDINSIFEALGGRAGFIRWSKKSARNLAQAYSMLGRSVLHGDGGDVAPREPDPAAREKFLATAMLTIEGIFAARERAKEGYSTAAPPVTTCIDEHGVSHVVGGDVTTPRAAHGGIPHTATPLRTIQEVPARVAQLQSAGSAAAVVRKPARVESIPGLNAGALLDVSGPSSANGDLFGRNFSQLPASRYGSSS
jgi:hypothetical protein